MSAHSAPGLEITCAALCVCLHLSTLLTILLPQPAPFLCLLGATNDGICWSWEAWARWRAGAASEKRLPRSQHPGQSCARILTQVTAEITAARAELCSPHLMMKRQQQPKSDGDNFWWLLCAVRAGRGNCPFRGCFVNRYTGNAHRGV